MYSKKSIIVILGCGGHGLNIADVILFNEPDAQIVFVDENARENEGKLGFSVVKHLPAGAYKCAVGIGDNLKRKKKFEEIEKEKLISVISQNAYIGNNVTIGTGCYISHLCMIGVGVIIGDNSLISSASVLGHECQIGRHCFIGPNATVAGCAQVGDVVFIGAGAVVIDKVKICSNTTIGAGATVVEDIVVSGTYVGTPARRIK